MFLCIMLVPFLCGSILFDDNFEDTTITGWTSNGTVQCLVDQEPSKFWIPEDINPEFIRVQYHGFVSFLLYDDSDDEIAYAQHPFPAILSSQEYMVEFYFHFKEKHKNSFKSFHLYKPTLMGSGTPVDITLKLNVVKGDSLPVSVIDYNGLHSYVYYFRPDTVFTLDYGQDHNISQWEGEEDFPIERWYRVQIHKVDADSIDLYINGEYINTYKPRSGSNIPEQFLIGTTNASFEGGVGIYDDFIITTPPQGTHPRLLLNQLELPALWARKNDNTSTIQRTYATYWNKIVGRSTYWCKEDRTISGYPYPYPEPISYIPDSIQFMRDWFWSEDVVDWTPRRFETICLRWLIGELDPSNPSPDTAFLNYIRTTILSFANWNHWMKPLEYRGLIMKHNSTYEYCIAMGYDCIFDSLSKYERMSIQNALLSQGLVPEYLFWETRGFEDPSVPFYPGHPQWVSGIIGFMALALDDDSLRNFYADYSEAIIESLYIGAQENEMVPVFGSDGQYAHGSLTYASANLNWITLFWEANRRVRNHNIFTDVTYKDRFENFPIYRLYMLCPGMSKEVKFGNDRYNNSPWHFSFCYIKNQQNSEGQWFLKRLYSYYANDEWSQEQYYGLNFLFFDDNLQPIRPTHTIGMNFGNNWIGMRTGLGVETVDNINDYNEVALIFDAHGKVPIHRHNSRNNFVIGSLGDWLINEQEGSKKNYESMYHNVIVVDSIWNNGESHYGQHGNSRGNLTGFHTDDNYCYTSNSIAEGCYKRLKKFVRKVIFTESGYAVIKDEVESSKPDSGRTFLWLVHVPHSTPIYGDSMIVDWSNRYHVKFFSPSMRTLTSFNIQRGDDTDNDNIRGIYCANVFPAISTEFLTAIVTKRTGYIWPPTIIKKDGGTMLGAEINSQVIILFGKGQQGSITNTTYTIEHSFPFGIKNVLADLIPEHNYTVYLNNQYATAFTSTDDGTGYFTISSSYPENGVEVTDTPHE